MNGKLTKETEGGKYVLLNSEGKKEFFRHSVDVREALMAVHQKGPEKGQPRYTAIQSRPIEDEKRVEKENSEEKSDKEKSEGKGDVSAPKVTRREKKEPEEPEE